MQLDPARANTSFYNIFLVSGTEIFKVKYSCQRYAMENAATAEIPLAICDN